AGGAKYFTSCFTAMSKPRRFLCQPGLERLSIFMAVALVPRPISLRTCREPSPRDERAKRTQRFVRDKVGNAGQLAHRGQESGTDPRCCGVTEKVGFDHA